MESSLFTDAAHSLLSLRSFQAGRSLFSWLKPGDATMLFKDRSDPTVQHVNMALQLQRAQAALGMHGIGARLQDFPKVRFGC